MNSQPNDKIKEKIKFNTEVFGVVSKAIYMLLPALIGVFFLPITGFKPYFLAFIGAIVVVALIIVCLAVYRETRKLLDKL